MTTIAELLRSAHDEICLAIRLQREGKDAFAACRKAGELIDEAIQVASPAPSLRAVAAEVLAVVGLSYDPHSMGMRTVAELLELRATQIERP